MEIAQLAGAVIFAISGVLAVAGRRLDWFGAIVIGTVTAIGGGTVRDLILGQAPVFWIEDPAHLAAGLAGSVIAILLIRFSRAERDSLARDMILADAAGLALFAVAGTHTTIQHGFDYPTAIVCGILTGVGGGILRDLLSGSKPLIMQSEVYATAALAGSFVFVLTGYWIDLPMALATGLGIVSVLGLRMASHEFGWSLPSLDRGRGPG